MNIVPILGKYYYIYAFILYKVKKINLFMKRLVLIPAALLLLVAISSFRFADSWMKYSSSEGHYSISFPGKPEESTQDDKTDDGTPFKIHFASFSPTDDEVYMAGWIDMTNFYPKDKDLKTVLEDSRDGAAGSMKAKVTSTTTNLNNNPYIEFTFETESFVGKDRIYVINKFQYSIITIFSTKTGISAKADKFIGSFTYSK